MENWCIKKLVRGLTGALFALCIGAPVLALDSVDLTASGVSEDLLDELRGASLSVAAKRDGTTDPQEILAVARADYARLVGVLYANAFYGGVVNIRVDGREAASIQPLFAPATIKHISIKVEPGPAFTFGKAEIVPMAPETRLPDGFSTGNVARSGLVQEAVEVAVEGWRDIGYAKTKVAGQDLTADHRRSRLNATVRLEPGTRLSFGTLILQGSSAVREQRLRQIAGLPKGQVFSPEDVEIVAARLRQTGVFQSVAVTEAETENSDATLDIIARVVDQKPNRFGFGAEVSTDEGVTISGFWLHRNLLGGAERLRIDAEIGGLTGLTGGTDLSFGARFERPATFGPDNLFFVETRAAHLDEPNFLSTHYSLGAGLKRSFSSELSGEVEVEWKHARFESPAGVGRYDLISLPVRLVWDQRDNALDPTRGHFLDTEIRPYLGFGSAANGTRFSADARIYRPLSDGLVLAGRLQLGSVMGSSIADTPPDFLFYSGGGGTVRGQSYESLDVDLGGGIQSGGRSFIGLSAEARLDVTGNIGIVGFADAGYIGPGSFFDSAGKWHSGAGLGLRYETGIGPIRLDVAVPVTGGGDGVQFYIGIGQAF